MKIAVKKFGGTSVGSPERIKNIATRLIKAKKQFPNLVIVVSAMGATTDNLVKLAFEMSPTPCPREYDALISTGENVSAALLAMALNGAGTPAISLTGLQAGIKTENIYNRAKIIKVEPSRIYDELSKGKIVIVTGFQGVNHILDVTTIGRGGSDTSAVVLASVIGASECDICTDVDGVYTTDPRLVKNARKLDEISYDEMLELASLGAKVLHPRSVECAKENNIVIHVRSSFKDSEGTRVKEDTNLESQRPVTGITLNQEQATLSILKVPDTPGVAGVIFSRLAEKNINVDMIVQSINENKMNDVTYTIDKIDLDVAKKISQTICDDLHASRIEWDDNIAKLSVVGIGMVSKPGVAAKMFQVFGDHKINIKFISTSEIKISCVINKKDAQQALQYLHDAFELDKH
ncbi:aspartate kinase [bacterium]|jgi:aspartate kinase|nr:aspartate kinase [bacterium]